MIIRLAEVVFDLGFYNQDSSVSSVKTNEDVSFRQRPLTVFRKMEKQKLIEDVLQKVKKNKERI